MEPFINLYRNGRMQAGKQTPAVFLRYENTPLLSISREHAGKNRAQDNQKPLKIQHPRTGTLRF